MRRRRLARSSTSCSPTTGARGSSGPTPRGSGPRRIEGRAGTIDTFEIMKEDALAHGSVVATPASTRAPAPARWTRAHEPTVERPIEVELKYRVVDLAAAERYLADDEIGTFAGTSAPRSSQLEDRYVDTADGALAKAGFAVRLRQSGKGTIVSVKSLARTEGAGGAMRREELEGPADRTAGPLDWPASDARSLVLELAGDAPLVELVTIRQLRRKRIVRDGDTRVELSLDEVDVVARSRVIDRFVELEAELVKGAEERLTGAGRGVRRRPGARARRPAASSRRRWPRSRPGRAGTRRPRPKRRPAAGVGAGRRGRGSGTVDPARRRRRRRRPRRRDEGHVDAHEGHAARGRRDRRDDLTTPRQGGPGQATRPRPRPRPPRGRAQLVRRHERRRRGRRPGRPPARRRQDAGRHRGRPHRRGRSQGHALPPRPDARPRGRCPRGPRPRGGPRDARRDPPAARRLARVRGVVPTGPHEALPERPARDRVAPGRRARPRRPARSGRHLSRRSAGHRAARRSSRFCATGASIATTPGCCWSASSIPTATGAGSTTTAISSGPTAPRSCRSCRPSRIASAIRRASRIWTAYEQVRGYEPVLRWADVETLHELRIAGKWLRYTLEFVREALGDDAAPLIARVTALQDHLGLMNDADVSASMARTFLVEHAGDLSAARERRDRALPRQPRARGGAGSAARSARRGGGVAGVTVPAHARPGGRAPCNPRGCASAARSRAPRGEASTPVTNPRGQLSRRGFAPTMTLTATPAMAEQRTWRIRTPRAWCERASAPAARLNLVGRGSRARRDPIGRRLRFGWGTT